MDVDQPTRRRGGWHVASTDAKRPGRSGNRLGRQWRREEYILSSPVLAAWSRRPGGQSAYRARCRHDRRSQRGRDCVPARRASAVRWNELERAGLGGVVRIDQRGTARQPQAAVVNAKSADLPAQWLQLLPRYLDRQQWGLSL